MNQTTKILLGIVILVLVIWAIASLSGGKPAEAGPIKIGFIGPLTGDAAVYGEPARNTTALAVEEINAAGGINGRLVEVIYEDGGCTGTTAANAARKLVNVDKVKVIIGGFCSSESLAAEPIATAAGVFLFSPGSSSPDLTGISALYARDYPSDAAQGEILAEIAYNDKNWRKVAFAQEQTDYALGVYKAFNNAFSALGGETLNENFPTEQSDFRTALTKLRSANPDALFISVQTPAVGEKVLRQLQDLRWNVPLLVSDVIPGDVETTRRNAAALEGALGAEFGVDPGSEKFQQLLAAYDAKYNAELPFQSYGQTEYDAVYILADAIREVGYDGRKIADWVRGLENWQGASGFVSIGEDGDRARGHVPKVIRNGKTELYSK